MFTVGKYIKITFYAIILFLIIKSGFVIYYKFFYQNAVVNQNQNEFLHFDSADIVINEKAEDQSNDGYNFKRMLSLIDACEKVRCIEHLQFSRPGEVEQINTQTLKSLSVALKHERKRLKHFIWQIRAHARQTVPSKRMKALKYYMRVMELNMQDVEEIICTRAKDAI